MVVALCALAPTLSAQAGPPPTKLRARVGSALALRERVMQVNRVSCAIQGHGELCTQLSSTTDDGGSWPVGSANRYWFASGPVMAGVVGPDGGPWAGDTTGAFFYDTKGTTVHGESVRPIHARTDPADASDWPEAARIATGAGSPYAARLDGREAISDGDHWFVAWDGNTNLDAGRPHPLGVVLEARALAWNYPAGNEDILYVAFTAFNATASDPAVYAGVRPEMRELLAERGREFQRLSEAKHGLELPDGGYTLTNLHFGMLGDPDVADAGANLGSVARPFDLGFAWDASFGLPGHWTVDRTMYAPFFVGPGLTGIQHLGGPGGVGGAGGDLAQYTNTDVGSVVRDPENVRSLYAYLSGTLAQAGLASCQYDPLATRICYVAHGASDVRALSAAPPVTLAPGASATWVVAYLFAAPVALPGRGAGPFPHPGIGPGDPLLLGDPALMAAGVNSIDSLAGYAGHQDDDGDGAISTYEFRTVPRSLYGKAQVAQALFDAGFVLPQAPEAPEFYVVPGDGEVAVLWRPSPSEQTGDPYFELARDPRRADGTPNPLYDPSYRQFDVEGYRIYRGRVDDPAAMTLVAQFDYAGTSIRDYGGQIDPDPRCAPELGIRTACPAAFDSVGPGVERTVFVERELYGALAQVRLGDRIRLQDQPIALVVAADTALVGGAERGACAPSSCPPLSNTGVPFVYVDRDVRNGLRYFYTVVAFDLNSWQSGPSSFESARLRKSVTPERRATNFDPRLAVTLQLQGADGTPLDPNVPDMQIDAATGRFVGRPAPTNGFSSIVPELVPVLTPDARVTLTVDSVLAFSRDQPDCAGVANGIGACYVFHYSLDRGAGLERYQLPVAWPIWGGGFDRDITVDAALARVEFTADPQAAAAYGLPADAPVGSVDLRLRVSHYIDFSSAEGQGARRNRFGDNSLESCGASSTNCRNAISVGGSRWFTGVDETLDHPTVGIRVGRLPGVDSVWAPIHHVDPTPETPGEGGLVNETFLQYFGYGFAGLGRHADVELTWGENGALASVVDLTHDVPVPFSGRAAASWGFLTDANGDGRLGWFDWEHIPNVCPFFAYNGANVSCVPTDPASLVPLVSTATIQPISLSTAGAQPTTGDGFALYINGERYHFLTSALPAAGTKWTLRTYSGRVDATSNLHSQTPTGYRFRPATYRSAAVPGLRVVIDVERSADLAAVRSEDLRRVHTVPDPYYVASAFASEQGEAIRFVNLPRQAIIRIYSSSGVLVNVIEHNSATFGGTAAWNVQSRNGRRVASGVYFYHVESGDARRVGRLTIINQRER